MSVPTSLPAGHVVLASELQGILDELNTRGLKPRGDRQTNSSTTTTEVGVLRIDGISIVSGRPLKIVTTPLFLASTVANDTVRAVLRASTSGNATTSSTQLTDVQLQQPNTSFPPADSINYLYIPSVTGTLSILLSVARAAGTGNAQILGGATFPIDMWTEDNGTDPGNTGVSL